MSFAQLTFDARDCYVRYFLGIKEAQVRTMQLMTQPLNVSHSLHWKSTLFSAILCGRVFAITLRALPTYLGGGKREG